LKKRSADRKPASPTKKEVPSARQPDQEKVRMPDQEKVRMPDQEKVRMPDHPEGGQTSIPDRQ